MLTRHRSARFGVLPGLGLAPAAILLAATLTSPVAAQPTGLVLVPVRVAEVMDSAEVRRTGRGHAPGAVPTTAPIGARLVATPVEGNYVRLADGTLWEVYLPDRVGTVTWRAGDYVTVSRAAAGVGEFDHLLVNGAARTRAFARFVELTPPRRR